MRRALLAGIAALALAGCGQEKLSPEAERGRTVYTSQCTACHAFDPSQPGPVGPEIKDVRGFWTRPVVDESKPNWFMS